MAIPIAHTFEQGYVMRNIPISILLTALLLTSLVSCSDPSSSTNPSDPLYTGNNGLVADDPLIGKVNFEGGVAAASLGDVPLTRATFSGVYYLDNVLVEVVFPAITPGKYSWNNLYVTNDPASRSHVNVTISGSAGSKTLYATEGSTVVLEYGEVGEEVTGTFSGTVKSLDGLHTVKLHGKFRATRIS
jgi:hypothetical protein